MRRKRSTGVRGVVIGLVAVALTAAGCGSSKSSGSTAASGDDAAALAAAKAAIAPYTGHPSAFPGTEKLASLPEPGSTFAFMQCSSPVCAIFAELLDAPTQALGVKLVNINAGASSTTAQAAAASALSLNPAAVLVAASNPQFYGGRLKQLLAAGSVVAGGGTVGGQPYGVQDSVGGEHSDGLAGALLADWVTVNKGPKANMVFFGTPELTFSPVMQDGFAKELAKNCASCKADYQQLSVATFGTTAPSQVISYLQSHPATNTVVFASMEGATGLAAALRNAHLNPTTLGFAPTASNLQDIEQGRLTAGLALDFNVQIWAQVNLAARLIAKQTTPESNLEPDMQFLSKSDLTGVDVSHGWTGYPDVAKRYAALWGLSG